MDRRSPTRSTDIRAERHRPEHTQEELLAMIAHEIRDPLTSCIGFAELLLRRGDDMAAEEQREALRAISR